MIIKVDGDTIEGLMFDTSDQTAYRVIITMDDGTITIDFPDHWDANEENPLIIDVFRGILQANFEGIEAVNLADVAQGEYDENL